MQRTHIFTFIHCCVLFLLIAIPTLSAAEDAIGQPEEFEPLPSQYSFRQWSIVRPHWMVGIAEAGSRWHEPQDLETPRSRQPTILVALNTKTGTSTQVRVVRDAVAVTLFPLDNHECGIVLTRKHVDHKQLVSWNLLKGKTGEAQPWSDCASIAQYLDLEKLMVKWPPSAECITGDPLVTIGGRAFPSISKVPLVCHWYATPLEMTSLWEEGKETRWYAPIKDRIGVVLFRGVRKEPSDIATPYLPTSTLTCFDPRAENGIRWQHTLGQLFGEGTKFEGIVPIHSPWQRDDLLTLQIAYTGFRSRPRSVVLARLDVRKGTVQSVKKFEADPGFALDRRWPQCTHDHSRVVYLIENPKYSPKLAVFDVSQGDFVKEIPCPSRLTDTLVTVLPTEEAVVTDQEHMWAIGVGRANFGKCRKVVRSFRERPAKPHQNNE